MTELGLDRERLEPVVPEAFKAAVRAELMLAETRALELAPARPERGLEALGRALRAWAAEARQERRRRFEELWAATERDLDECLGPFSEARI